MNLRQMTSNFTSLKMKIENENKTIKYKWKSVTTCIHMSKHVFYQRNTIRYLLLKLVGWLFFSPRYYELNWSGY